MTQAAARRQDTATPPPSWQIDKKIPLALILSIIVQSSAIVWWAATSSVRLDNTEKAIASMASQSERIVRLETKLDALTQSVSELKGLLAGKKL